MAYAFRGSCDSHLRATTGADALADYARGPDFYLQHQNDLRVGDPAVAIVRDRARVLLASGVALAYEHLVLAKAARRSAPA